MLAFGISNRGHTSIAQKLCSTHPPRSKRIQALQEADIISHSSQQQIN